MSQMVQLLPLLLMLLFSVSSFFSADENLYSFHQTREFNKELKTAAHNVPFFVNMKTYQKKYSHPSKRQVLEANVESEYYRNLQYQCSREKEHQRTALYQASSWITGSKEALDRARSMKLPKCEEMHQWRRT